MDGWMVPFTYITLMAVFQEPDSYLILLHTCLTGRPQIGSVLFLGCGGQRSNITNNKIRFWKQRKLNDNRISSNIGHRYNLFQHNPSKNPCPSAYSSLSFSQIFFMPQMCKHHLILFPFFQDFILQCHWNGKKR